MESNSNTPSYQNYQGNVNLVMSPAPYAASNSNGTLNPTLHTGGTVLPSTPQRTTDLTLQTISSVNQVLAGNIAPTSTPQRGSMYTLKQGLQQTGRQQMPAGIHVLANHQQTSPIFHENTTGQQGTMNVCNDRRQPIYDSCTRPRSGGREETHWISWYVWVR